MDANENIVISGISGRFPKSANIKQFQNNLMNKVDLISDNGCRWKLDHPEIPTKQGRINDIDKFDADFFGISAQQANCMDPAFRVLMEHTYETIVDAGVNPCTLRGTKTGVYIGGCFTESEMELICQNREGKGLGITGCPRSMAANRISSWLGVTGPSCTFDCACSSSLLAVDQAYWAIRNGQCDAALVGGFNICLHPNMSLQFTRLGLLSEDGRCKSFDESGNGYVRAEAISIMYLQKRKAAKRLYATIVYAKSNCDGFTEEGITFPSMTMQSALLKEFYEECKISPHSVAYVETHGTGTKAGDPAEVGALDATFCPGRRQPLKIGTVKSNMGHAEGASAMTHIAKAIIANETGIIPPNLHYKKPHGKIDALRNGRIEVVTEPTPWNGGYMAINSFGIGGSNTHILLKSHSVEKINCEVPLNDLPRLVFASGRTREAVETILDEVEKCSTDVEFIGLLHDIHAQNVAGHLYRGYTIIGHSGSQGKRRKIDSYSEINPPVVFVFTGMSTEWPRIGTSLLRFAVFANAIKNCTAVLKLHDVNVDLLHVSDELTLDNVNTFVGVVAVQIGLVDLLESLGVVPDLIIGHSLGEVGCAYADGCLTAEEAILTAYYVGKLATEIDANNLLMAIIGLGREKIKNFCPSDVEIICHNNLNSSTAIGPVESMKNFICLLMTQNVTCEEVHGNFIAYHSKYVAKVRSKLLTQLKTVIPNAKPRSEKWLSTSIPQSQWKSPAGKLSSAEYHTNSILSPVLFEEALLQMPANAVSIEIAPCSKLHMILQQYSIPDVTNVVLTENSRCSVDIVLQGIGKLYNLGCQPVISKLYPKIQFPVSRGTPMISPLIRWNHTDDWYVMPGKLQQKINTGERILNLSFSDEEYEYLKGHVVDEKGYLPCALYVVLVWETLGMMKGEWYPTVSVVFQNVKIFRTIAFSKNRCLKFTITIEKETGAFEVVEDSTPVVTGNIRCLLQSQGEQVKLQVVNPNELEEMTSKDVYKEFLLRGHSYSEAFKCVRSAAISGCKGTIRWANNWTVFLDNMLQLFILGLDTRKSLMMRYIDKLTIDVKKHTDQIRAVKHNEKDLKIYVNKKYDAVHSEGIHIWGVKAKVISRKELTVEPILEGHCFIPHKDGAEISLKEAVHYAIQLCLEHNLDNNVKILEAPKMDESCSPNQLISSIIVQAVEEIPMIQAHVNVLSSDESLARKNFLHKIHVIEPTKLCPDLNASILVGRNLLTSNRIVTFNELLATLKPNAFIITLEPLFSETVTLLVEKYKLHVIIEKIVNSSTFLLLRKMDEIPKNTVIIQVNTEEFRWLNNLKIALKENVKNDTDKSSRILLVSDKQFENGLLGLIECLRGEPGGEMVRGVLIQDPEAPEFSVTAPIYAEQLQLDLAMNVLRPRGTWGSYRYQRLLPPEARTVQHACARQFVSSDLGSLQWIEGPLTQHANSNIVRVIYSALNFKDVLVATGQLSNDVYCRIREQIENSLSFEYAGITRDGRRVMGLINSNAMTNLVACDPIFTWTVPNNWTLKEAATVPWAYTASYCALHVYGEMKKGNKILIHAGAGALGQAAITLALWMGCEVFTTVSTEKKKMFITQTFPDIPYDHIGNSRDTSFEQMIMKLTNGKGVDIVLNSLTEDKVLASVRCLAEEGRFLEIGKSNIYHNHRLEMFKLQKEISFHSISLNNLFNGGEKKKMELYRLIQNGLDEKIIKPLEMTVFLRRNLESAFSYMANAKHIGKVIIKIQDEHEHEASISALPYYRCREDSSYLIVGGLGGFGFELCDWLILRGARYLILTSSLGVKDGYQQRRIKIWENYGVKIMIMCRIDASNAQDCEKMFLIIDKQYPPLDAIYNLACVFKTGDCENQTPDAFDKAWKIKVWSTKNLDELSKKLCPQLRHFVVFSCALRNMHSINYGMANSAVERLCEKRANNGLPGLAIQWGKFGDVGSFADMPHSQFITKGTVPQRVTSCFRALDAFLNQDLPVVRSIVIADKDTCNSSTSSSRHTRHAVDAVLSITGLKDIKSVNSFTSLAEHGVDSIMIVEIKNILESEFDICLTLDKIRKLTLAELMSMKSNSE